MSSAEPHHLAEPVQNQQRGLSPSGSHPRSNEQMTPFELSELQLLEAGDRGGRAVNEMALRIEMGRTVMRPSQLGALRAGAVVALDALVDEPVTIFADERPIAHGEVMVLNDEYCVRVTELIGEKSTDEFGCVNEHANKR